VFVSMMYRWTTSQDRLLLRTRMWGRGDGCLERLFFEKESVTVPPGLLLRKEMTESLGLLRKEMTVPPGLLE